MFGGSFRESALQLCGKRISGTRRWKTGDCLLRSQQQNCARYRARYGTVQGLEKTVPEWAGFGRGREHMELCTASGLDMKYILDLYQSAFPANERKPFSVIERKTAMGEMEVLLIREEGKPAGLAVTALGEELVLLDYFAIDERMRGRGIGSDALQLLIELYGDRGFFLEIEDTQIASENSAERIARKEFYLRNGMLETGIRCRLFGVDMELLSARPGLTYAQCEKLYRSMYGPMYQKIVYQTN